MNLRLGEIGNLVLGNTNFKESPLNYMYRLLILAAVFGFSLMGVGCSSACKKMQKTNSRLISGKETFGMKKNSKFKKQNRRSA